MRQATSNLHGQRFGRLMAQQPMPRTDRRTRWLFSCDCGRDLVSRVDAVRSGKTLSCGCLNREATTRHGGWKGGRTKLYGIWSGMKERCTRPKHIGWHRYGGRGITFDPCWADFASFKEWALDNGYRDGLTLDRFPNPNGNYEPSNCRWATPKQQCETRVLVGNRKLTTEAVADIRARKTSDRGVTRALAEEYGVSVTAIRDAYRGKTWAT